MVNINFLYYHINNGNFTYSEPVFSPPAFHGIYVNVNSSHVLDFPITNTWKLIF